ALIEIDRGQAKYRGQIPNPRSGPPKATLRSPDRPPSPGRTCPPSRSRGGPEAGTLPRFGALCRAICPAPICVSGVAGKPSGRALAAEDLQAQTRPDRSPPNDPPTVFPNLLKIIPIYLSTS